MSSWRKPKGDEESAELMSQFAYPVVNRCPIELGSLPRSSFFGPISVVFRDDAWRAESMYVRADHPPTEPSHAFRDLEEEPAAERDADRPVDQGIDGLGHQMSLHARASTAQLTNRMARRTVATPIEQSRLGSERRAQAHGHSLADLNEHRLDEIGGEKPRAGLAVGDQRKHHGAA